MKPRTCPHCKYQYSLIEYFTHFLFKISNARWHCKNCHSILGLDPNYRLIISASTFLPAALIILFSSNISELINTQKDITLIIALTAYAILALFIYSREIFVLIKKKD